MRRVELHLFLHLVARRETIRIFQTLYQDLFPSTLASCGRLAHGPTEKAQSMAKKTTITIETDSLLIMRGRNLQRAWCPICGAESEMIALSNVAVISNLDRIAVEEWLNSSELHRSQSIDGSDLFCLNSLLARMRNRNTD